jgi:acetyl-CoA acyltransferase
MQQAVIAGYVRTPFHFARKGALAEVRPDDLAGLVVKELVARDRRRPGHPGGRRLRLRLPEAEQGNNIARIAVLLAGLPIDVAGMTVNRFCGSSMSAIHIAAGQIAIGAGEAFIAGGVESMTRCRRAASTSRRTRTSSKPTSPWARRRERRGPVRRLRAEQEELAFASQQKAAAAQAAGRLKDEIVGVMTRQASWTSTAASARRPPWKAGRSQARLSGRTAASPPVRPRRSPTGRGDPGHLRGLRGPKWPGGPGPHPRRGRRRLPARDHGHGPGPGHPQGAGPRGLTIDDIDVVEINEAFGSQAVACVRELTSPGRRSTSTAAASPSATRWAPPAHGSPPRPPRS